jgi:hypothetical protein
MNLILAREFREYFDKLSIEPEGWNSNLLL